MPTTHHPRRDRRRRPLRTTFSQVAATAVLAGAGVSVTTAAGVSSATAAPAPTAIVDVAFSPAGGGWDVTSAGSVIPFGGAGDYGSVSHPLNRAIVGMTATPDGHGYWLVASDGGIFAFGDANFHGSTGGIHLNQPVVGMTATRDGGGYWMVASDGGIFSFGDASFHGSTGSMALAAPIAGMARTGDGGGYWLIEQGGQTFAYGDATPIASPSLPAPPPSAPPVPAPPPGAPPAPFVSRPFSPSSPLYRSVTGQQVAADSASLVSAFGAQVTRYYGSVGINTTPYGVPIYRVGAAAATVAVSGRNSSCPGAPWAPFTSQVSAVPIPADAVAAAGSDGDLVVWQPASDTVWELWRAQRSPTGAWSACSGGRITHASSSKGVFPNPFGVTASGLSLLGGTITLADLASGSIDHALEVALPDTAATGPVAPADRSDGSTTGPLAIPEGTHFRLNAGVDVDTLHLSPAGHMIAVALQRYGMIVSDTAGAVMLSAQDPTPAVTAAGADPYTSYFAGHPEYQVTAGIPWSDLQVVTPS